MDDTRDFPIWTYYGHKVRELARREVAGGVAVDVERVAGEPWPWTVSAFTVNAALLRPVA